MNTIRLVVSVFALTTLLTFSNLASATNSLDGSSLTGTSGNLVTSAGTWTFSSSTGAGGNLILLNGSNSAADSGSAVEMFVGNGGNLYQLNNAGNWYEWNGGPYWTHLGSTSPFPLSADGTTMMPGGSVDLVTSAGIWAFSTATGTGGNLVALNGSNSAADGGSAVFIEVNNGGHLYALNSSSNWYEWNGSSWTSVGDPVSDSCATAAVVGLTWGTVSTATSYSITRNGSSLATTPVTYYNDQTVVASTSYTYVVKALDGSTTLSTQTLKVTTAAASPNGDAAYCPSTVISGMTWNWSTGFNQLDSSDLWPATWGNDGTTYVFWGDGPGLFGSLAGGDTDKASFGIGELKLTPPSPGTTPALSATNALNIYGGPNAEHLATLSGKLNGLIAIGNNFYGVGGVWLPGDGKTASEPYQIYGGPNHTEIVYSIGNAYSWTDNSWQFCNVSMGESSFCGVSFVNFGAGNSGSTDSYIYLLGATYQNFIGNGGLCNCTYLARVLPANILTYADYQVYAGMTASGPNWVTNGWSQMQPIFQDNGKNPLVLGKVVYNAGLKRFIGMGQDFVNQAAFYDAPNPWGPWTTIEYYGSNSNNTGGWGNLGTTSFEANVAGDALGINFMNEWTSSSGTTMWATFSSDGTASTGADLMPLQGESMDSLSIVSVTLSLY